MAQRAYKGQTRKSPEAAKANIFSLEYRGVRYDRQREESGSDF